MPNDNLGTAHGSIRLDLDDRASGRLVATLLKMQKQFETMDKRLVSIDKALKKADVGLDDVGKSMDRASKSSKAFSGNIFDANRKLTKFARDSQDLVRTMKELNEVFDKANTWYKPIDKTFRVIDQMQRSLALGEGRIKSFGKALSNVGVTAAIRQNAFSTFFGVKSAIREMPMWTQSIYKLAGSMAKVGAAGLIVGQIARANPFGRLLNTKMFAKFALQNEGLGMAIERFVRKADHNFNFFSRSFNAAFKPIANFAKDAKGLLTGFALINSGINGIVDKFRWLGRIPKPILMALGVTISTVLPAALEVFGKALSATSNLLVGLLDGVKQLSGGFLALPGAIATIGAAGITLGVIFGGLKDKIKDAFSDDPAKKMAAFMMMPAALKPVVESMVKVRDAFKGVQSAVQAIAFKDVSGQIDALSSTYLPKLQGGASQVAIALRKAKDEMVAFAMQGQTKNDFGSIFTSTAQTISNLARGIQPLLAGFRDLAVVGAEFISNMSSGFDGLTQKFAAWAALNRSNGNLMKWMEDSRKGVIDLVHGLVDLSKALWTVLTIFKTNTGSGFLDNFAKSMKSFNDTVQKSAAAGVLRDIGNAVRDLGTDKIDQFKTLAKSLLDMLQSIWPVVKTVSQTFSSIFVPALQQAMTEIKYFAAAMHDIGVDRLIGAILGIVGAFKLIPTVLVPAYHALKTFVGVFLVLKNQSKIVDGVNVAINGLAAGLGKLGPAGQKAATSVRNVGLGSQKIIGSLAGAVGVIGGVGIAVAAVWAAWSSRNDTVNSGLKAINDTMEHSKEFATKLTDAFKADRTHIGGTVMDTISGQIDTMFSDIEEKANTMPGIIDHIGDFFSELYNRNAGNTDRKGFIESDEINQIQDAAGAAQKAQKAFKEAGITQNELKAALAGSTIEYANVRDRLMAVSDGGQEAANALDDLKNKFDQAHQSAIELGEGGALVADGVKKIAESAGDATTKLDGLREVLEGLGILKTTALEATAAYEKGIRDLASSVTEAVASGASMDDLIDKQTGTFNVATEAGSNFFNVFKELGNEFLTAASKTGDVDGAYKKFTDQLGVLQEQTHLSRDQLIKLASDVGLVPDSVKIALSLENATPFMQDVGKVLLQAQANVGNGIKVPVGISTNAGDVAKEINNILGRDAAYSQGTNLFLKPGIQPGDLEKLKGYLAQHGISLDGQPVNSGGAQLPIKPTGGVGQSAGTTFADTQKEVGESQKVLDDFLNQAHSETDKLPAAGHDAGSKFAAALADGMKDGQGVVGRAADILAEEARSHFHQSPPKKGPLAAHGDAALYAGKMFGTQYATGLDNSAGAVGSSASGMAGTAVGSLRSDKMYQAGEFLGQISQLVDFAQHFTDAMTKLGQTILGFAKFASDPLGKGTFFGKSMGFEKAQLTPEERADRAQSRVSSFYGTGQRDTSWYDAQTGMPKITGQPLTRQSSKEDIVQQMVAAGQAAGMSKEQITGMVATANAESGFNPMANGGIQGGNGTEADRVLGIFQEKASFGSAEDRTDPNQAINRFIQRYQAALQKNPDPITAAALAQNPQLGGNAPGSDYANAVRAKIPDAAKSVMDALAKGGAGPTTNLPFTPGGVTAGGQSKLVDETVKTVAPLQQLAAELTAMFPGIASIGGSRAGNTVPGTHDTGTSIDIGIGKVTPENQALGDQIKAYVDANAARFGLKYSIWRDKGTDYTGGAPFTVAGHQNHIDAHYNVKSGVVTPTGTPQIGVNSPYAKQNYGLPPTPEDMQAGDAPKNLVTLGPNGEYIPVPQDHLGTDGQGNNPVDLNPATGKPWTPEEAMDFWNKPENAKRYDANSAPRAEDQGIPGVFQGTQDEMLNQLKQQTPLLSQAVTALQTPSTTDEQALSSLQVIQDNIDQQNALGTAQGRATASQLESIKSQGMDTFGMKQKDNPIDSAMGMIGSMSSVAGSIFTAVKSGIEAIGAGKNIGDTLVRGVANTEDIFNMVDDVQKFIQFAADVAGAVSSTLSAVGQFMGAGGADPTGAGGAAAGAVQAAGQIAGLVQSALETVNAMIDLGQEAYRIVGSMVVGPLLGFLTGGGADSLQGNVRFLLDQQSGELLAYSQDNPLDKRPHSVPGYTQNDSARNQLIGNVNVYGGPGSDPRDNTRQMMYQIKASTMAGATGQ